jgi:hypothetical protein
MGLLFFVSNHLTYYKLAYSKVQYKINLFLSCLFPTWHHLQINFVKITFIWNKYGTAICSS